MAELVGRESTRDQVRPDEHRRSASYAEHPCLAVRSGKCCIDFLAMRLHIIFEPLPIDACSFGCHTDFFGTELVLDLHQRIVKRLVLSLIFCRQGATGGFRSEEHTSELLSLMPPS